MIPMNEIKTKFPYVPVRMQTMLAMYGRGEPFDATCGKCIHLQRHKQGAAWMKCDLQRQTGPAGDWKAKWPACGKFEPASTLVK